MKKPRGSRERRQQRMMSMEKNVFKELNVNSHIVPVSRLASKFGRKTNLEGGILEYTRYRASEILAFNSYFYLSRETLAF